MGWHCRSLEDSAESLGHFGGPAQKASKGSKDFNRNWARDSSSFHLCPKNLPEVKFKISDLIPLEDILKQPNNDCTMAIYESTGKRASTTGRNTGQTV